MFQRSWYGFDDGMTEAMKSNHYASPMNPLNPGDPQANLQLMGPMEEAPPSHSPIRARRLLTFLLKYWWVPTLTLVLGAGAAVEVSAFDAADLCFERVDVGDGEIAAAGRGNCLPERCKTTSERKSNCCGVASWRNWRCSVCWRQGQIQFQRTRTGG